MWKDIKPLNIVLFFVISITVIIGGLLYYNITLRGSLSANTCETLEEIMQQQKLTLEIKLNSEIATIVQISDMISDVRNYLPEENIDAAAIAAIKSFVGTSGFKQIIISNANGEAINDKGVIFDISDKSYFIEAVKGKTFASETMIDEADGSRIVAFSTPLYRGDKIIGVAAGLYDCVQFSNFFIPAFDGMGTINVMDKNGDIVFLIMDKNNKTAKYPGLSFHDVFVGYAKHVAYDDYATIMRKMSEGAGGHVKYSIDGKTRMMHYAPLGVNDWYIASIVPEEVVSAQVDDIVFAAIILMICSTCVTVVIFIYFGWKQKKYSQQLYQVAYFDELTGIPNLTKVKVDSSKCLKESQNEKHVAIKFDVLKFKIINEIYDFTVGDKIIVCIADTLRELVKSDTCVYGRLGGDEFVAIFAYADEEDIDKQIYMFENKLKDKTGFLGEHKIDFRYGRYFIKHGETDVDDILEKVNLAHRIAKTQKTANYCDYSESYKDKLVKEIELENAMEASLKNEEFIVYLQPKYNIDDDKIIGAEALVRWQQDENVVVQPNTFIPLFEKNGFILKLDMYMLRKVCQILRNWIDKGVEPVTISVNFSKLHLEDDNFSNEVESIVNEYQIPRRYIEIELTETSFLKNEKLLQEHMQKLHEAGFTLSMDNFGTGFLSLNLLKNLPIDEIKIDRCFFVDNNLKARSKTVISNVLEMAKGLGINTVAEGVETKEHIKFLQEAGCDAVQGYYYAKPMPVSDFIENADLFSAANTKAQEEFTLENLGDIQRGRGDLGDEIPVSVYRLFQQTIRSVLNTRFGEEEMAEIFRAAGVLAGRALVRERLDVSMPFDMFMRQISVKLEKLKSSIFKIKSYDDETGEGIIVVDNDPECSGFGNIGNTLCQYDEGFIAGIMQEYTKNEYTVTEIECWGTGGNSCRFELKPKLNNKKKSENKNHE